MKNAKIWGQKCKKNKTHIFLLLKMYFRQENGREEKWEWLVFMEQACNKGMSFTL